MANWKEIAVDYIVAKLTSGKVHFGSKGTYTNFYGTLDFADDDIPNWRAVQAAAAAAYPVLQLKISAGTPIPANINMSLYPQFGPNASVIAEINKAGDNTKLIEFADIGKMKNYSDSTYIHLLSIDIYGHDDGTGKFAEDTFITIKI